MDCCYVNLIGSYIVNAYVQLLSILHYMTPIKVEFIKVKET